MTHLTIRNAQFYADIPTLRGLISEYIAAIDRSACREEVEAALAGLPAPYDQAESGFFLPKAANR